MKPTEKPTEETEPTNTAPAFREEVVSTLREAEVVEWLARLFKAERDKRYELKSLNIEVFHHRTPYEANTHGFDNVNFDACTSNGRCLGKKSSREAIDGVLAKIIPPKELAEAKRAAAASLLAEADEIERNAAAGAQ